MSAHTPGPWHAKGTLIYAPIKKKYLIATCLYRNDENEEVANARLIAAAPLLLAALIEAIEDSEEVLAARLAALGENYRPLTLKAMREDIAKGRAAIAKATGAAA